MSFEQFIASISEEDLKRLNEEYYKRQNKIPTYQYSRMTHKILRELVDIEKKLDKDIFNIWFENNETIDDKTVDLFEQLIEENEQLIESYSEEDLKVNFLIPILNNPNYLLFNLLLDRYL